MVGVELLIQRLKTWQDHNASESQGTCFEEFGEGVAPVSATKHKENCVEGVPVPDHRRQRPRVVMEVLCQLKATHQRRRAARAVPGPDGLCLCAHTLLSVGLLGSAPGRAASLLLFSLPVR